MTFLILFPGRLEDVVHKTINLKRTRVKKEKKKKKKETLYLEGEKSDEEHTKPLTAN